jgi:prenyltransferase beta subunit
MELKFDAFSFVMERGKAHRRLEVLLALGRRGESFDRFVAELWDSQNADGGWSWMGRWPFEEERPSSVYDTAVVLGLILRAGESRGSVRVEKAVSFLFSMQRDDGGWGENPRVHKAILKGWIWYSVEHSVTWITATVINALILAGYRTDPRVVRALDYLRNMQNEEGGWPSHVGASGRTDMWTMEEIVEAFVNAGEPRDSPVFAKALEAILKYRERWKEPAENPLGVFVKLGYGLEHPYVKECVDYLVAGQHEDGGWGYYNEWESKPGPTAQLIRHLVKLGVRVKG